MTEAMVLPPEVACATLMSQMAFHLDDHDVQSFVALFTNDGTMISQGGERLDRDGIAALLTQRSRERITRHVFSAPWIERIGATEARGRLYLLHYAAPFGAADKLPLPMRSAAGLGEYRCKFRLTERGWRISEMELLSVFKD